MIFGVIKDLKLNLRDLHVSYTLGDVGDVPEVKLLKVKKKRSVIISVIFILYYYHSINQNLNKRLILECQCDERLKDKVD